MKFLPLLILFWIFPVLAQVFLPGTEDIPLMNGLQQVEETASFDNPDERMVLISAETNLPPKKIFEFYQESLKNLGWGEQKIGQFKRGNDFFSIEVTPTQKTSQIQFRLSQRNP